VRDSGNKGDSAHALDMVGQVRLAVDDLRGARQAYEEALSIRRALGWPGGPSVQNLAEVAEYENRLEAAETLCRQAVAEFAGAGQKVGEGFALQILVEILMKQGKWTEARAEVDRGLALGRETKSAKVTAALAPIGLFLRARVGDRSAIGDLEAMRVGARAKKNVGLEVTARLYLGRAELALGRRAGRGHLLELAKDMEGVGHKLLARVAREDAGG